MAEEIEAGSYFCSKIFCNIVCYFETEDEKE